MRVIIFLAALLGVARGFVIHEEGHVIYEDSYVIENDNCPMARLARDYMPHIKTQEQLRNMEIQLRANMNQYVDHLLVNARTYFLESGLDPMTLPDYIRSFQKKVLGITWNGQLGINNGHLQDLATIYRSGDVNLDYKNKILLVDANLGFKDLQFSYDFKAKFMALGPKGYVVGRGNDINIQFKVHLDLDKGVAGLDLFDIKSIRSLTAKLQGLGVIVDWLIDFLANMVLVIFKGPIVVLIEHKVGDALSHVIANIDISSFIPRG
ncbi:mite allergen Der f 7-like [Ischnura elegans]|uniref:mite allergen Der f 7-like n=1 Tax=Ischnura elegans TaxID=197161 RepID=UPI001ED8BAA2|nr:mite allergen Der f 7-like [Ischnura elegans]